MNDSIRRFVPVMRTCWLLQICALFLPGITGAEPMGLTPESSAIGQRGITYAGEPVFLVGSGSFWLLNDPYYYNPDGTTNLANLRQHLDKYRPTDPEGKALGVIRVSAFGTPVRYSGVEGSAKRYPCARSGVSGANDGGNKFDCSRIDQQFFDHTLTVVREADERGIVIGVILWDEIPLESGPARWIHNPFCPSNSVVDYALPSCGSEAVPEFYDLSNALLLEHQAEIVRKFVSTLKNEPNVFFFISNEYTGNRAWRDEQIAIVNDANVSNGTRMLHVTMDYGSPGPSSVSDGVSSDTNEEGLDQDAFRPDGRPAVNQRDYRRAGSGDAVRRNNWARFMDGAASAGTRDDYNGDDSPSTTYAIAAETDQRLRDFVNSVETPLDNLAPMDERFSSGWNGRGASGSEYIAFSAVSGGSIAVDLTSESGTWQLFEWRVDSGEPPTDHGTRNAGQEVSWDLLFVESAIRVVRIDAEERARPKPPGDVRISQLWQ